LLLVLIFCAVFKAEVDGLVTLLGCVFLYRSRVSARHQRCTKFKLNNFKHLVKQFLKTSNEHISVTIQETINLVTDSETAYKTTSMVKDTSKYVEPLLNYNN
jgi:hypothetical protein